MMNINRLIVQGLQRPVLVSLVILFVASIGIDHFDLLPYTISDPLYNFSIYTLPLFIVLFFTRKEVFSSWLNFAKWYLPVTVILIAISPTGEGGFLPPLVTKETASLWLGILFLILSLLLIAYKSYILRGK